MEGRASELAGGVPVLRLFVLSPGVAMIMGGAIEQLIRDAMAEQEEQSGLYYCGCRYILGQSNCPHHGDPPQRWPSKRASPNDDT